MISLIKPTKNKFGLKLAICVFLTFHNKQDLSKTIKGIEQNIYNMV
jgi:hypothetical protein